MYVYVCVCVCVCINNTKLLQISNQISEHTAVLFRTVYIT